MLMKYAWGQWTDGQRKKPHRWMFLTPFSLVCRFWEMAFTFTGLKLQGSLGRFGKTSTTDIEGYAELPDGKVSEPLGSSVIRLCVETNHMFKDCQ